MKKLLLMILCGISINAFADREYSDYQAQEEQRRYHEEQLRQQRIQQDQQQANQLSNEWEAGMEARGAY